MEAYPLSWPLGYKRNAAGLKKHAAFKTSFADARDGIMRELKMMGATSIIISTNVPLKRDGLPYAVPFGKTNITDDTGIAVYFNFDGEQKVICCDAYICLDDNMQAINKTVEALRGIDRWGCSDVINQTFTGFKALPESRIEQWYDVLQVPRDADDYSIKSAYKRLVMQHHPDKGGDLQTFHKIKDAYDKATTTTSKPL